MPLASSRPLLLGIGSVITWAPAVSDVALAIVLLLSVSFCLLGSTLQGFGQLVERLVPALVGTVADLAGRKAFVTKSHFRLSAEVFELDGDEHLQRKFAGHPVIRSGDDVAVLIGEAVGADDTLVGNDLSVDSGAPDWPTLVEVWRLHCEQVLSAHTEVDFGRGRREVLGTPPALRHLGVRPRLPDQLSGSVEFALDDKYTLSSWGIGSIGHSCPPSL